MGGGHLPFAQQHVARAHGPGILQLHAVQRALAAVAQRRTFRHHGHPHAGGHHAAHGVEVGQLDAQPQCVAQLLADLVQKGLQRAVAVHADKVLVQHLGKRDLLVAAPGGCVGGDQHQAVGAEVQAGQAVGVHLAGDDAQVRPAFADVVRNVGIGAFLQVHADVRVLHQVGGQDVGHELRHRRGVGKDAHMAAQAGAVFLQIGLQLAGLLQHGAGMVQEGLARRRQAHSASLSNQQRHASLFLQRLDARAGRRQRQMRLL